MFRVVLVENGTPAKAATDADCAECASKLHDAGLSGEYGDIIDNVAVRQEPELSSRPPLGASNTQMHN